MTWINTTNSQIPEPNFLIPMTTNDHVAMETEGNKYYKLFIETRCTQEHEQALNHNSWNQQIKS